MVKLRKEQGLPCENQSDLTEHEDEYEYDIFDVCSTDMTDEDVPISAFKLMVSILNSEFKSAQQVDEHLVGSVRKGPSKFPRICALFCLLEIIGDISSKLLKHIVFDEGDFSRPNSTSNKFISLDFVRAARQHVNNYILNLPTINKRPIIYIDKNQVERAYMLYTYIETTTKLLFDTSYINQISRTDEEISSTNSLSKKYVVGFLFFLFNSRKNVRLIINQ